MQCEISFIEMACFKMRVYNWISGNKNRTKCTVLNLFLDFNSITEWVRCLWAYLELNFLHSLFNGTLCCLVMDQSSAILLSQLVCLKGSWWLSMEGLLSVNRKIKVRQTPPEHCFFSAKSQYPDSRFLLHFYEPQLRVKQHRFLYWKTRESIVVPSKGRDLLCKWWIWIFWHDILFW